MKHSINQAWRIPFLGFILAALVAGCGGGGSGGSTPGPGPTVGPTLTPTGATVVVQLRDLSGNLVDGIVTLGAQRRATTGGNVTFLNAARGAQSASAEVTGRVYSQSFVATIGTTTVGITINPALTPIPGGTVPPPPF